MKRFVITENDRKEILSLYGVLSEQELGYKGLDKEIKKTLVLYPKEEDLYKVLKRSFENEGIEVETKNRDILNGAEIDIYIPEYKVGVEFQGDDHYKYVSKIISDKNKKKIAERKGIKLINLPYYFGWDNEYMNSLTDNRVNFNIPNSKFGFLESEAFPSSFSEDGIERFISEVDELPIKLQKEILESLLDRQNERYSSDINDDFPEWNPNETYYKDMVVRVDDDFYIARRQTKTNPTDMNSDWGIYLYPDRKMRGIYDIIPKSLEDWYMSKLSELFGFK